MRKDVLPFSGAWAEAFGQPERTGVWFVWGNSGNGKTSFVMQLCRELARFGKVAYNSLEEGASLTMVNTLRRFNMQEVNRRFVLLDCEPMDELSARMAKRRSADFVVIDSYQYSGLTYIEYKRFKEANRNKLIVFVSHADGSNPAGRSARSVMYDATLKVWVEGYKAYSKGRFIGPNGGVFTVWEEGARRV
jgi:molybdopterin-guanine dinucleotide biosynthesis protein